MWGSYQNYGQTKAGTMVSIAPALFCHATFPSCDIEVLSEVGLVQLRDSVKASTILISVK